MGGNYQALVRKKEIFNSWRKFQKTHPGTDLRVRSRGSQKGASCPERQVIYAPWEGWSREELTIRLRIVGPNAKIWPKMITSQSLVFLDLVILESHRIAFAALMYLSIF